MCDNICLTGIDEGGDDNIDVEVSLLRTRWRGGDNSSGGSDDSRKNLRLGEIEAGPGYSLNDGGKIVEYRDDPGSHEHKPGVLV